MKHNVWSSFLQLYKLGKGGWFHQAFRSSVVEVGDFMHNILSKKPA
jgi:hypothetical protein